ncbi:MAG: hypothetical protein GY804_03735, partial [Alphaproteobacteria bacterium]|nr:hypothetical protein [Alphaproteobacteria bacterium]
WFNSTTITSTVDTCDQITDKSSGGRDLTTAGNPLVATDQVNGIQGIFFDGVDDVAINTTHTTEMGNTSEFWVLAVIKNLPNAGESNYIAHSANSTGRFFLASDGGGEVIASGYYNGSWSRFETAAAHHNETWLTESHYDGAGTLVFKLNNTIENQAHGGGAATTTSLVFGTRTDGSSYPATFYFMEAVCTSSSVDAANIYTYLYNKYGFSY